MGTADRRDSCTAEALETRVPSESSVALCAFSVVSVFESGTARTGHVANAAARVRLIEPVRNFVCEA